MSKRLEKDIRAADYLSGNTPAVRAIVASRNTANADPEFDDELAHMKRDLDLEQIYIHIVGGTTPAGKKDVKRGANIKEFVLDAVFEDSITATPTFTLTILDPDWDLLNSGALEHAVDIQVTPTNWYRLDAVSVDDDTITLTFITRNAKYLMYHNKRVHHSRRSWTRAQFIIKSLIGSVKASGGIHWWCPEIAKVQPIAKGKQSTKSKKEKSIPPSNSDGYTVNGHPANSEQLRNINDTLRIGVNHGAHGNALIAGMAIGIVESGISNHPKPPNPPYKGAFQQNPKYWPATETIEGDAPAMWDALLKAREAHPQQPWGYVAEASQGAVNQGYPAKIDAVWKEAKKNVKIWMGSDNADLTSTTVTVSYPKTYEFDSDPDQKGENYLAATYRLAEQVNWAAFWIRNDFCLASYDYLFKQRSVMRFFKGDEALEGISFNWNNSAPKGLQEMTLTVRMDRWMGSVGSIVTFGKFGAAGGESPHDGGPARGRWVVASIRRSMFEQVGTVTLMKPLRKKKEPAHDIGHRTIGNADDGATYADAKGMFAYEVIDKIVIPQARKILGSDANGTTVAKVNAANAVHGATSSGGRSDHQGPKWYAWAADMSNTSKGNYDRSAPTEEMDRLAKRLEDMFSLKDVGNGFHENTDERFRYQLIYRTDAGGGHWNHVHFGCHLLNTSPPALGAPAPPKPGERRIGHPERT
jgi:hypothetical protein